MIVTTKQLFKLAYGKYAIGAYNINNMEQTLGLFQGCLASQSPFIVQLSKGARKYANTKMIQNIEITHIRRDGGTQPPGVNPMKLTSAQFYADTINTLLAGHRVIIIDARAWQNWQPDSDIVTLKGAKAFAYDHAPGDGYFHITSSYGVHDGLDTVSIKPDDREIVMYSSTAAGGQVCWRVIRDLELEPASDWYAWKLAQEASLKLER